MIPFVKFFNFTFSQKEGTDMKSQAYRMAMLFDFYGDVLTPRNFTTSIIMRTSP